MEYEPHYEYERQVPFDSPEHRAVRDRERAYKSTRYFGLSGVDEYEYLETIVQSTQERILHIEEQQEFHQGDPIALREHQNLLEIVERSKERKGETLRKEFSTLLRSFIELVEGDADPERIGFIAQELGFMLEAPEIQSELHQHFGDQVAKIPATSLLALIDNNAISNAGLYHLAQRHVQRMREKKESLNNFASYTQSEFVDIFNEWVERGVIPASALENLRTLEMIQIELADRLLEPSESVAGTSDQHGDIRVSDDQLDGQKLPRLRKTIFHELLHSASGKSITIKTEVDREGRKWPFIYTKKLGVRLGSESSYKPNEWLNEAITEWLALQFSGYHHDDSPYAFQGSYSYPEERKDLEDLFQQGLSVETVTRAYFENFRNDQKEGKGSAFKELIAAIERIKGPGGFSQLENLHLLRNVVEKLSLGDVPIFPAENITPEDREHYKIDQSTEKRLIITAGNTPATSVEREFIYFDNGKPTRSGEAIKDIVDSYLSMLVGQYNGRVTYRIVG